MTTTKIFTNLINQFHNYDWFFFKVDLVALSLQMNVQSGRSFLLSYVSLMFLSNFWRTKSILKNKKTSLLRKYYIYVYTFYKALLKDSSLPTTILRKKKRLKHQIEISLRAKISKEVLLTSKFLVEQDYELSPRNIILRFLEGILTRSITIYFFPSYQLLSANILILTFIIWTTT